MALKKLALKNQAMAVNLENLLPQALSDPTPFTVPSNGSEQVSDFGDLFSPSMYGNSDLSSLLGGVADVMNLDPLVKADFPSPVNNGGIQYVNDGETLYQTPSYGELELLTFNDNNLNFTFCIDVFSENNWMTTPMSLPLTPDESTGTAMTYTTTPTFTGHTPVSVPLTPESLVSPQSSTEGEELEEVLSYFADSANEGQDFGAETNSGYPTSHVYQDSEY